MEQGGLCVLGGLILSNVRDLYEHFVNVHQPTNLSTRLGK